MACRHRPCKQADAQRFNSRTEKEREEGAAWPDVAEKHGEVDSGGYARRVVKKLHAGFGGRVAKDQGEVEINIVEDLVKCLANKVLSL